MIVLIKYHEGQIIPLKYSFLCTTGFNERDEIQS